MATKELIKAEIDKIEEDEDLEALYGLVKRLAGSEQKRADEVPTTIQTTVGPSSSYIGSPRLVRRS